MRMVLCCAAAASTPAAGARVAVSSAARRSCLQAPRRTAVQARAGLPSLGAALRRLAGMASAGPQPWLDPSCFTTERWWNDGTVAVVTGGNKGIGKEIVRQLSAQGLTAVLTARDERRGAEAAREVSEDVGRPVPFCQLDVTDAASVAHLASWLKETYGGVDILVNNAGMAYKGDTFGADEAQKTIETNAAGTLRVTNALLPLLRGRASASPQGARVVNVCSSAGKLRILRSDALATRFNSAATAEEVMALMNEFVADIRAGRHLDKGWPNSASLAPLTRSSMYGVSKLGECCLTRVLAREQAGAGIFAAAICPGWCATDMSSRSGPNTAAQGADTAVWAALAPRGALATGRFWRQRTQESF